MRMSSVASNSSGESSEEFSRKRSMVTANLGAEEIEPYVRRKRSNSASEKSVERVKKRAENLSEEEQNLLRTCINSRERRRMHDLNDALDDLRRVIPYSNENNSSLRKLSKITTVILATNWIRQMTSEMEQLRAQNEKLRKGVGMPTVTPDTVPTENCLGETTITANNLKYAKRKLSQPQQQPQPELPAFVGNPMIFQFPTVEQLKSTSPRCAPKMHQNKLPQNAPMPILAPLITAANFQQSMAALNAANLTQAFQRQLNGVKINHDENQRNSQAQLLNSQSQQLRQFALAVGLMNTVRNNNSPAANNNSTVFPTVFNKCEEFPTAPNINQNSNLTVSNNKNGETVRVGDEGQLNEITPKTCRKCCNSLQNNFSSSQSQSQLQSQSQSACLCMECILSTKSANSNVSKN